MVDTHACSLILKNTSLSSPILFLEGARADTCFGFLLPDAHACVRVLTYRIPSKKAAECLASYIAQVAQTENVVLQELAAIACGIGPGSFTGLRVVMSFAKGLAIFLKKPLLALSSLQMMLEDMRMYQKNNVNLTIQSQDIWVSVIVAFAKQVYAYAQTESGTMLVQAQCYSYQDFVGALHQWLDSAPLACVRVVADNGVAEVLRPLCVHPRLIWLDMNAAFIDAAGFATHAVQAYLAGEYADPYQLVPNYIKDAQITVPCPRT